MVSIKTKVETQLRPVIYCRVSSTKQKIDGGARAGA